ncbi:mariner Mos1 transposase [Nephila pilipes]|uniref:Mariner Mos1 transposase n=1 Tax=Nephila pilipes TaxID=299642 RepID=A0A8X6TVW3_NEPPI|nr:mariner Mos1 transposase [Nephila pilipes]
MLRSQTVLFENGETHINEVESEGMTSTATNSEIAARVNECILENGRITIDEISNELDISHGSVHKIIADHLQFHELFSQWELRLMTEKHKGKHFESTFEFLQRY